MLYIPAGLTFIIMGGRGWQENTLPPSLYRLTPVLQAKTEAFLSD